MTQTSEHPPFGHRAANRIVTPPTQTDAQHFSSLAGALWRGKFFIFFVISLAVLVGGYYAFFSAVPKYSASAVVMLNSREEQVVDLESVVGGLSPEDTVLNSEVYILRSRGLIGKVVDDLELTHDPEFNPNLQPLSLKDKVKNFIQVTLGDAIGRESAKDGILSGARGALSQEAREREDAINLVLQALSVRNLPSSLVFEVRVETIDPQKSASIADTLVDLYILNQIEVKYEATEKAANWLADRVAELQVQLETAEARVKEFRSSTDVVNQETIIALERQLTDTRNRISDTRMALEMREADLAKLQQASTIEEKLQAAKDDQRLQQLSARFGQAEMEEVFNTRYEQIISRVETDILRNRNQIEALATSRDEFEARLNKQSNDLIRLQQLTREAESIRLLYEYFLARRNETSAQQGVHQADSRQLSKAVPPVNPVSPKKSLILMISTILGFLLGASVILMREIRYDRFRTPRELEMTTGYRVHGVIPLIRGRGRKQFLNYLIEKPTSAVAEAVRNLRTSILMSDTENPPQLIMISSSYPGEGKTTLSLSIAQNMAAMGKRVLVIEGDIRRRMLDAYLETPIEQNQRDRGVMAVLEGRISLQEAVLHQSTMGLDMLISETTKANAADVLSSARFEKMLQDARKDYDHIIIDTPPVLVVPDARIVAKYADCVLCAVRWNGTSKADLGGALEMFETVNRPVDGLILNQVNVSRGSYGYGYGYGYGYSRKNKYYTN